MHHHDEHDHDGHGGLHRDLRATGAVIGRRSWLRMAARLGAAAGTLQLVGCGGDSPTSPSATTTDTPTTTTTTPTTPTSGACSRIPEETAGRIRPTARTARPCSARAAWFAATSGRASPG